jgi:hypothetical protein
MGVEKNMREIKETLDERAHRYGKFSGHASIAQSIKDIIRDSNGYDRLSADKREALEMIAHKIARILNGDPNYVDSFRDIAGYATLIVNELSFSEGATDVEVRIVERINGSWQKVEK